MQINGTIFNVELIDILTEVKTQLALNGIQRFAKIDDGVDDVMVCCPYHKDGKENRPSAGIRKSDGLLHCLACGKTVGLDEMIANCFGHADPLWGYRWLTRNFLTVKVEERADVEIDLARDSFSRKSDILGYHNTDKSNVPVNEEELDKYRYTHKYLYERGLTDGIIELFDIGYDIERDSITFPVKNIAGDCIFIARRSVRNKRFDLPKDLEKPLYGLYEMWCASKGEYNIDISNTLTMKDIAVPYLDSVYVCEGLFDCLRLWCNGKIAVAGFGCLFSEYQMKQLRELPTRKLILAFDNDKAGRGGAERIRKAVRNKLVTEVIIPNGKKDIGELTDEEINNLEEVF